MLFLDMLFVRLNDLNNHEVFYFYAIFIFNYQNNPRKVAIFMILYLKTRNKEIP